MELRIGDRDFKVTWLMDPETKEVRHEEDPLKWAEGMKALGKGRVVAQHVFVYEKMKLSREAKDWNATTGFLKAFVVSTIFSGLDFSGGFCQEDQEDEEEEYLPLSFETCVFDMKNGKMIEFEFMEGLGSRYYTYEEAKIGHGNHLLCLESASKQEKADGKIEGWKCLTMDEFKASDYAKNFASNEHYDSEYIADTMDFYVAMNDVVGDILRKEDMRLNVERVIKGGQEAGSKPNGDGDETGPDTELYR